MQRRTWFHTPLLYHISHFCPSAWEKTFHCLNLHEFIIWFGHPFVRLFLSAFLLKWFAYSCLCPFASEILSSSYWFPKDFYKLRIGTLCLSHTLQIIPKAILMKQTNKQKPSKWVRSLFSNLETWITCNCFKQDTTRNELISVPRNWRHDLKFFKTIGEVETHRWIK